MIATGVVCVVLVVLLLRRRARAKARLAGLEATRPVYSVEPPGGRLARLKDSRL